MGEEKVTMILKVDLQCEKCYRKVKKVLCKFPQIRDQTYEEKNDQVIIKVVCCSPEKIRDKLCSKGGGAIKSIEIKEPEKPKETEEEKKPPEEDKSKAGETKGKPKKDKSKDGEKQKDESESKPKNPCCMDCYGGRHGGPCKTRPPPPPVNPCCMECYGGRHCGPCETRYGYGRLALYIQYDGYYGRPVYDSYGGGRSYTTSYCVTHPDCFCEENPQACPIM